MFHDASSRIAPQYPTSGARTIGGQEWKPRNQEKVKVKVAENLLDKKIYSDKVGKQKKDESDKEESEDHRAKSKKYGKNFAENYEIQKAGRRGWRQRQKDGNFEGEAYHRRTMRQSPSGKSRGPKKEFSRPTKTRIIS